MTETLLSAALCALLLWWVLALLCAAAYPLLRRRLLALDPAQAGNFLLAYLALPLLGTLGASLLLYGSAGALLLVSDHCHAGQCSDHGPLLRGAGLALLPVMAWYAWRLVNCVRRQWWPGFALARQLRCFGQRRGAAIEIPAAQPAAFTLGWWHPRVYLTSALLQRCTQNEVDCILAHEASHHRRRDNLRQLLANALAAPVPLQLAATQLEDLALLHELAADRDAAHSCTPEAVAGALLRVARLQRAAPPAGSVAFAGTRIERRVRALVEDPPPALPPTWSLAIAALVLCALLAAINPLHRLIETLP
ncbi:M56 family peptidase [Mangrovimicrobium sediminis]|uniref:M56 family peptidase n=1 Tax=Mangrovimicrobium sediminis TaxID=2562682 RepID=A0A4Z0M7U9_9GAMM|nr:M56 family metallopeptidase [Haliea sp. SAOS-164]TGD75490.1 M56 family peptidase [Haliea sp. SAOS-164]